MARKKQDIDDADLGWGTDPADADTDPEVRAAHRFSASIGKSASVLQREAARSHLERMGIDAEQVSDAVRLLSLKFSAGPLEILWRIADDPEASKSARSAAAMAIMPYLQGRVIAKPAAADPNAPRAGVMVVPPVDELDSWEKRAARAQDQLKRTVRE